MYNTLQYYITFHHTVKKWKIFTMERLNNAEERPRNCSSLK
jgi:hypothetical protein